MCIGDQTVRGFPLDTSRTPKQIRADVRPSLCVCSRSLLRCYTRDVACMPQLKLLGKKVPRRAKLYFQGMRAALHDDVRLRECELWKEEGVMEMVKDGNLRRRLELR